MRKLRASEPFALGTRAGNAEADSLEPLVFAERVISLLDLLEIRRLLLPDGAAHRGVGMVAQGCLKLFYYIAKNETKILFFSLKIFDLEINISYIE
jgi:hypothetical protein